MKTKFLLTLLALNSLLLGSTSVSAATNPDVANLSRTISSLVDLGSDSHSLMESAINRALLAQKETKTTSGPALAGGIGAPPVSNTPKPLTNGIIANPYLPPQPPLINGVIANPEPQTPPPLINGVILNPNPATPEPLINDVR
jgi:hypothetical protein